jgi:hypothetical protein
VNISRSEQFRQTLIAQTNDKAENSFLASPNLPFAKTRAATSGNGWTKRQF